MLNNTKPSTANKIYNIVFTSQDSNCTFPITGNYAWAQFKINLGSFLPIEFKKFRCQFTFFSQGSISYTILSQPAVVYADFWNADVYQNTGKTKNIGLLRPNFFFNAGSSTTQTVINYYSANLLENPPFIVNYPYNTQTVNIGFFNVNTVGQFTATGLTANFPQYWTLTLSLIPIE
jgi:hypothetical protein